MYLWPNGWIVHQLLRQKILKNTYFLAFKKVRRLPILQTCWHRCPPRLRHSFCCNSGSSCLPPRLLYLLNSAMAALTSCLLPLLEATSCWALRLFSYNEYSDYTIRVNAPTSLVDATTRPQPTSVRLWCVTSSSCLGDRPPPQGICVWRREGWWGGDS